LNPEKLTEFITVLLFAMVIGAAGMLAVLNLRGVWLTLALTALTAATVTAWQYLRKRFGRHRE
jgi:uncharacterized membrane protein YjjP (DUF1212 family)